MLYDALVFLVVALIAGCLGLNCLSAVFYFSNITKRLAPYAHNYAKDKNARVTKYTLRVLAIVAPTLTQRENIQ